MRPTKARPGRDDVVYDCVIKLLKREPADPLHITGWSPRGVQRTLQPRRRVRCCLFREWVMIIVGAPKKNGTERACAVESRQADARGTHPIRGPRKPNA